MLFDAKRFISQCLYLFIVKNTVLAFGFADGNLFGAVFTVYDLTFLAAEDGAFRISAAVTYVFIGG